MPVEFDASTITGEEKAAILLLSLNEQDAAGIIRHLEPKQVQRVGSAMARAKDLSQEKVSAVHRTFLEDIQKYTNIGMGSEDFMRNALVAALGEDKANNLVDQILLGTGSKGLDSLKWMDHAKWQALSSTNTRKFKPSYCRTWKRINRRKFFLSSQSVCVWI